MGGGLAQQSAINAQQQRLHNEAMRLQAAIGNLGPSRFPSFGNQYNRKKYGGVSSEEEKSLVADLQSVTDEWLKDV